MVNVVAIDHKGTSASLGTTEQGKELITDWKEGELQLFLEQWGVPHSLMAPSGSEELKRDQIASFVARSLNGESVLLSKDNMVSFFGLQTTRRKVSGPFGLVVVDQHMDVYSYQTHGERLNKANVYRHVLDARLVDHIAFVGIRPSEELLHHETQQPVPEFDRTFARILRRQGVHAGLDGKITVIPSYDTDSLSDGIIQGLKKLRQRGIRNVGLDFDLDGFDSDVILGVDYNKYHPQVLVARYLASLREVPKGMEGTFQKLITLGEKKDEVSRREFEETLGQVIPQLNGNGYGELKQQLAVGLWLSHQVSQEGLSPYRVQHELETAERHTRDNGMNVAFTGITEFEPHYDGNGRTGKLVRDLTEYFPFELRRILIPSSTVRVDELKRQPFEIGYATKDDIDAILALERQVFALSSGSNDPPETREGLQTFLEIGGQVAMPSRRNGFFEEIPLQQFMVADLSDLSNESPLKQIAERRDLLDRAMSVYSARGKEPWYIHGAGTVVKGIGDASLLMRFAMGMEKELERYGDRAYFGYIEIGPTKRNINAPSFNVFLRRGAVIDAYEDSVYIPGVPYLRISRGAGYEIDSNSAVSVDLTKRNYKARIKGLIGQGYVGTSIGFGQDKKATELVFHRVVN